MHSLRQKIYVMKINPNILFLQLQALESPSGDSGIESGACSSPARSEQDIPILPPTPSSSSSSSSSSSHHQHNQDDMPVLKRALQAPPMIDTNLLMNEAYRPHKKFR